MEFLTEIEPPVVEVTIDTSQFECGIVEPQIVHDVDLYYQQQQQQQQDEAERIQAMLHRQQQEEELQRQQEEVERQRLLHEQILLQRQQEEEAELQRQREIEEQQRLEQEERARWQQEEEYRRMQEVENLRREQEAQLLLAQEKAEEEERLRCQQLEEEQRRREQEEMEEAERQRQELERVRWQQEEEYRRMQEAEILRLKQEMEERLLREQQDAERARQEYAEAERVRREQEEAERIRREQEAAERIRREQEAAQLRQEQEDAERIRQQQEAELIRRREAAELIRQQQEVELIRQQQEAERIRQKQEEAERRRQAREEAERMRREQEAERLRWEQEEADRLRQEQEKAEILRLEQEEAERLRREQEEAERIRREREEAERMRCEQEEAERIRREQEEAERIRRELEEAERIKREQEAERIRQEKEEAERIRQEEEERKNREREEAERLRLEKEEIEKLKREQEEAAKKRVDLEKAEQLKREKEEAEKRRLQHEEKLRKEQEAAERLRKEREEAERLRREREKKRMEEEEQRLKKKRLEEEEKERLHQEYLDKQTAAALIQIPVQVPIHAGPPPTHEGMLYQPIMPGMGQPWSAVPQPGYPSPVGMGEVPPGYNNVPHYRGEMSSPPHSSSPPPIPGLGPPSPSQGEVDLAKPPSLMSLDLHRPSEDGLDDDMRLPQALEKVLAYKMERAQMLGVDPDTIAAIEAVDEETAKEAEDDGVEMEDAAANKKQAVKSLEPKPSKNKQRKLKKKKRARHRRDIEHIREISMDEETGEAEPDVEVQYIEDSLDLNPTDPMYHHFMKIFEAFKLTDPEVARREAEEEANKLKLEAKKEPDLRKKPKDADEDLEDDQSKKEEQPKLSKRKLKKLNRLSIAELKQHVNRPDVVEMHDVTAKDPRLLVILKSTRNTVPVPRHWCFKRKFLQGKRGIEKSPFDLPDFIKKTGIMEMRQALQEKEDQKTLKAKMRERVRPKMGKIDIDYQKLHDAFFKWQTKPKMTIHGDLYYEGKEFETRLKEKKPGELSDDLRTALGMPVGPNSQKVPPPWLIAMQRYGPPPSYPNLKIPGLNSPIPDSCSFGYHAGGWGKPPVDEMGKPLYGDVFGMQGGDHQQPLPEEEVDRTLWGELESESESESEEEEDEEEEEEEDEMELDDLDKSGFVTPAEGGLVTPSGISSIPMGMETPDMIELRKRKIESEMEGGETPALYTILPEKKTDRLGSAMMGSTHIYDIAAAVPGRPRLGGFNTVEGGVDVALDPSELDLDAATMTARYEQTLREQQNQLEKEDLSDMVAEHSAKQKNKRKRAAGEQHTGRAVKKYKDFKF